MVAVLPITIAVFVALGSVFPPDVPNAGRSVISSLAGLAHYFPEGTEIIRLDTGPSDIRLDPEVDYVVILPDKEKLGPLILEGGRNILIDGGHIVVVPGRSDWERRGIYIKDATGTVRIANVFIEGRDDAEFDAIAIAAPEAVVRLVNIRVEGVRGDFAGFHADIVQPFGGVKKLVVNGLTGRSNYQGFYLPQTSGRIGSVVLRNVNLAYDPNPSHDTTYLLWLEGCNTYPVTLRNVYIEPRPGQRVGLEAVRPNSVRPGRCPAVQQGQEVTWPSIPGIEGMVIEGTPPAGDFVPPPNR